MTKHNTDLRAALAARPERFRIPISQLTPDMQLMPESRARASYAPPLQHSRTPLLSVRSRTHGALDRLRSLGLTGMARAFARLDADADDSAVSRADWLALLLDEEATERQERRAQARLRIARLRYPASIDDVDYRAKRSFDRALFKMLATGRWIGDTQNLIIEGPAGVGKSWLACALGQKACRDGRSVLYQRVPRMLANLALARGTARHARLMRSFCRADLLILDDWGLAPLGPEQRHDMLEIAEERYLRRSTLFASQTPIENWPGVIGEPVLATLVLDRIVHNAHRLTLSGDSMRRGKPPKAVAA